MKKSQNIDETKVNNKNWKSSRVRGLFFGLLFLTVVAGGFLLKDVVRNYRHEKFWNEVRALREAGYNVNSGAGEMSNGMSNGMVDGLSNNAAGGENILPKYQALYEKNQDMVGWLTIDWCKIDYPIMQTKDDPEHYLRLNFDGEFDTRGTPFIDYRCSISPRQSFNLILYGHYSHGDNCFRRLLEYAYEDRMKEHREFYFDTLNETGIYEVEAAFYYDASDSVLQAPDSDDSELAYEFYNYIELDSEEGFERFLNGVKELTLYSWEPDISPKDKLLTIVCCAPEGYSSIESGGRFVVIAKKK